MIKARDKIPLNWVYNLLIARVNRKWLSSNSNRKILITLSRFSIVLDRHTVSVTLLDKPIVTQTSTIAA